MRTFFQKSVFLFLVCGLSWAQIGNAQENRRGITTSLAVSHDGKWIAANDGKRVFVSDARTGRVLRSLSSRGKISQLAVSPDGKTIAAAGADVEVRDGATGALQFLFTKPEEDFRAVAFSPDNRILAAAGAAKFKDVNQGHTFNYSLIGEVRFWEMRSGKMLRVFRGESNEKRERFQMISALAWSRDGKTLAVGGILVDPKKPLYPIITENQIAAVELWDARSGVLQSALECPLKDIHDLNFGADGNILAGGDKAGTIRFWNTTSGALLPEPLTSVVPAEPVALLPDGKSFVAAARDGAIRLHDAKSAATLWSAPEFNEADNGIAFSADDLWLAVSGKDSVALWNTKNWLLASTIQTSAPVSGLAWSGVGDKTILATADEDGQVKIWDSKTTTLQSAIPIFSEPIAALAWLPDGSGLLVVGKNRSLSLWDVASKRPRWKVASKAGVPVPAGDYKAITSPDGKFVAISTGDGVDWRETNNGKLVRHFRWPQVKLEEDEKSSEVSSLAISSDGGLIAAAGWRWINENEGAANEIRFWSARDGRLLGVASAPHPDSKISFLPGEQGLVIGSDFLETNQIIGGEKSVVLTPLWKTGGAYRGQERD